MQTVKTWTEAQSEADSSLFITIFTLIDLDELFN